MATTTLTTRMTLAEFRDTPDLPEDAELIHGELVRYVNAPSRAHSRVGRALFRALDAFATPRGLGEVYGDMTGYELPLDDDDMVVIPDVSFVLAGREEAEVGLRGYPRMAPDLAVEVQSDSDRSKRGRQKLAGYLRSGASLVWLVDPASRSVEVHAPGRPVRRVAEGEVLDGESLLPGFAVPVADLFRGVAREG